MIERTIIFCAILTLITFSLVLCEYNNNITSTNDVEQFPGELCYRDCNNAVPRICYYKWHLENYHLMGPACGGCAVNGTADCDNVQCITGDGIERAVMSINRQLPGPPVHMCKDDIAVVDVTNMMGGSSATLHWHGFHHRKTPYMDGVPFITQCPIIAGSTFRYTFPASDAGTQFYHSHSGHHKVNGNYGGFVVRTADADDPNSDLYDLDLKEHLIVASDTMDMLGEEYTPGLRHRPIQAKNFLVNGRGVLFNPQTLQPEVPVPFSVFRVERGKRYRFRFVNSFSHSCPVTFDIVDHPIQMIATDSFNHQPLWVDEFTSYGGERYDFIVHANSSWPFQPFQMRLRGIGPCANRFIQQYGFLSYAPAAIKNHELELPKVVPTYNIDDFHLNDNKRSLNHPQTDCARPNQMHFCIVHLQAHHSRPDINDVDITDENRIVIFFGFHAFEDRLHEIFQKGVYRNFMNMQNNDIRISHVDDMSLSFPNFPILTQPELITEDTFCNKTHKPARCEGMVPCPCTYNHKIALGSVVELIIIDQIPRVTMLNHPWHLHGFGFYVHVINEFPQGMELSEENVKAFVDMHRNGTIENYRTNALPPLKDTVAIPPMGVAVVRFKADNPGFWIFHCHFEWHASVGMGMLFQVGEPEDFVKPPEGFPKCQNYVPSVPIP